MSAIPAISELAVTQEVPRGGHRAQRRPKPKRGHSNSMTLRASLFLSSGNGKSGVIFLWTVAFL